MKGLLLIFLLPAVASAQPQERSVLFYNLGFGGLTAGIGAVINKPVKTDWKAAFIRGFWQGAAGGLVNYGAKKTLYLVNRQQSTVYLLPAAVLHNVGYSLMENAALHEPFLQNWNFDYGPLRVDFSLHYKKPVRVRLLPESLYAAFWAGKLGKLDAGPSLLSGTFAFRNDDFFIQVNGEDQLGASLGRAFAYVGNYTNNRYNTVAHEMVHGFQYREYQVFNAWLKPAGEKIGSKKLKRIFSNYVYPDLPYFWGFYALEGHHASPHYFKNFYEFEAERFATNRFVPIR